MKHLLASPPAALQPQESRTPKKKIFSAGLSPRNAQVRGSIMPTRYRGLDDTPIFRREVRTAAVLGLPGRVCHRVDELPCQSLKYIYNTDQETERFLVQIQLQAQTTDELERRLNRIYKASVRYKDALKYLSSSQEEFSAALSECRTVDQCSAAQTGARRVRGPES